MMVLLKSEITNSSGQGNPNIGSDKGSVIGSGGDKNIQRANSSLGNMGSGQKMGGAGGSGVNQSMVDHGAAAQHPA